MADRNFGEEFRGDCMLNGEPSVPSMVRFGRRAHCAASSRSDTPGAHAAYTHASPNAIRIAAELIRDLYELEGLPVEQDDAIRSVIEAGFGAIDAESASAPRRSSTRSRSRSASSRAASRSNMLPGHCRIEVDIRLPIGMTHAFMLGLSNASSAASAGSLNPVWTHSCEPTVSAPDHEMVSILKRTVSDLGLPEPVSAVSLGATDCNIGRQNGVPSYVYGCGPVNMAKPDEHVEVEEFLHVLRTMRSPPPPISPPEASV